MSVGANYLKVIKSFAIVSDTSCTFWLLIVCTQRSHMESIDPIHPNPIRPLFYNLWNPKAESVCWSSNRSKYNMKTKYPIYVKKWYRKKFAFTQKISFFTFDLKSVQKDSVWSVYGIVDFYVFSILNPILALHYHKCFPFVSCERLRSIKGRVSHFFSILS